MHATANDDPETSHGTILRLVPDKGFGFIRATDGPHVGQDLFFHRSALIGGIFEALDVETRVSFITITTSKGLRAEEVKCL